MVVLILSEQMLEKNRIWGHNNMLSVLRGPFREGETKMMCL